MVPPRSNSTWWLHACSVRRPDREKFRYLGPGRAAYGSGMTKPVRHVLSVVVLLLAMGAAHPAGETPACGNCQPRGVKAVLADPESGGCSICLIS